MTSILTAAGLTAAAVVVWLIRHAAKAKQPRRPIREHAERRQGSYYGEDS